MSTCIHSLQTSPAHFVMTSLSFSLSKLLSFLLLFAACLLCIYHASLRDRDFYRLEDSVTLKDTILTKLAQTHHDFIPASSPEFRVSYELSDLPQTADISVCWSMDIK